MSPKKDGLIFRAFLESLSVCTKIQTKSAETAFPIAIHTPTTHPVDHHRAAEEDTSSRITTAVGKIRIRGSIDLILSDSKAGKGIQIWLQVKRIPCSLLRHRHRIHRHHHLLPHRPSQKERVAERLVTCLNPPCLLSVGRKRLCLTWNPNSIQASHRKASQSPKRSKTSSGLTWKSDVLMSRPRLPVCYVCLLF